MGLSAEHLSDIEAIKQLKYRYVRALDTADRAAMEACLTADAHIKFEGGVYTVEFEGRDKILDFFQTSFHSKAATSHQLHHPAIELTSADTAKGQWSLQDMFHDLNHRIIISGAAEYVDDYVKDAEGQWRISKSGYTRLYEMTQPMPEGMMCTYHRLSETGQEIA